MKDCTTNRHPASQSIINMREQEKHLQKATSLYTHNNHVMMEGKLLRYGTQGQEMRYPATLMCELASADGEV